METKVTNHVCPSCGHCSCCGRGLSYPTYPYVYPYNPYYKPTWIWSGAGNIPANGNTFTVTAGPVATNYNCLI